MTEKTRFGVMTYLVLAVTVGLAASAAAQDESEPFRERFTARAVAMGTSNPPLLPPGTTATIDINITRWTTDDERQHLFEVLTKKGQRAMVREMRRQPETGWVRVVNAGPTPAGASRTPSERLRYARQIPLPNGGRRIVLGLDRPITMSEAVNQPRWRNFDVTLFFIDLDAENVGEGQLAIGVRLTVEEETNTLKIQNFATEPVRLTRVTPQN
ncbi:MAG TPA: hypothetical protein VLT32_05325 [Candidatus Sulfomarinibacteraceae bacterium]|nr:hypothetical protein [Candidatus Sulfomarinibacteraceae bacterium]